MKSSCFILMAVVFLAFMEGPWPGTALADNVLAGELPSIDTNTEVDHFKVAAISSSPIRNAPVQVKITAHDLHGALMTGFTGSAAFNASSEAGVLACTPATSGAFVAGVWSGEITFGAYASTALLTVRDAQGHTGTSNAFAVVRGPLDHFDWSPIATPQAIDAPFTVAIKPQDAGGNMVEEFTGPVQLSAVSAARRVATGVGNGSSASGLLGNQGRGRLQCLYTPAEVGGAGRLMALEFNVVTPGQLATNHPLTIRLKHTSLTNFTNSRWEADGWTTVYQGAHTYTSTGLVKCQFTAPFDYDGTSNLLVDFISSQSPTGFGGFAYYQTTESQGLRKIYYETYDQSLGDPLTWDGTAVPSTDSSNLPVLRFTAATKNSLITPISSGLFSGGLWSGNVSVPLAGSAVRLVAESADGLRGASNEFAVRNSPPLNGSGVVYREGFENGPLSASWELTGTSRFRALIATANAPRSGFRHLTLDANSISEYARNEATWTVDLAGLSALSLKFWAKGFSETADAPPESSFVGGANFDGVAISTDGITWHEVQPLRPLGNAWVQYNVNLDAAIATLGLTYNTAFRIRFNQYGRGSIPFGSSSPGGIAIDDIEIVSAANPFALRLTMPVRVTEGGSAQAATVSLPAAVSAETVVALTNSSPSKVSIPSQVTIPAGQLSAVFLIRPLDDPLVDGDKTITLTASASYFPAGTAAFLVTDNDLPAFDLNLSSTTTTEGAAPIQATLTIPTPAAAPLSFTFTTTDSTAFSIPANATLQSGATSVVIPLPVVNDNKIDGPQTATVSVFGPGGASRSVTLTAADNETRNLQLSSTTSNAPTSVIEGSGAIRFFGSLPGSLTTATTMTFASSAPGKILAPAAVTIPAGFTSDSNSAVFTVLEDELADGPQVVTLTASAEGFTTATYTLTFLDNDPHHFAISPLNNPLIPGAAIPVTITARDPAGNTLVGFSGSVNLSAASGIAVSPALVGPFVSGLWKGIVQLDKAGTNVTLAVNDGVGHSGVSNTVDVAAGSFSRYSWALIDEVAPGIHQPVTVHASDAGGNPSAAVNGPVAVRALGQIPGRTIGTGTSNSMYDFLDTSRLRCRNQTLYLASELGGAQLLSGIELKTSSVNSETTLSNFTVRVKMTPRTVLDTATGWDADGWTTVYRSALPIKAPGWLTLPFDLPFEYDGSSNLLVDFSFNNASNGSLISWMVDAPGIARAISGSTYAADDDPLYWSGKSPAGTLRNYVPHIRFLTLQPVPAVFPADPAIASGSWNGTVSFPGYHERAFLEASDSSGHRGFSNSFRVATPLRGEQIPFFDGFENAAFSSAWNMTGTGSGLARVATTDLPHTGSHHALLDHASSSSRVELTLSLDLAGCAGVHLEFWAKKFDWSNNAPPASPFTGGADFDGVAISMDGINWYEVQALRQMTVGEWTRFRVDLDAFCTARQLAYTSAVRIRFNEYGYYSPPDGGIAIDDVAVTGNSVGRLLLTLPTELPENEAGRSATVTIPAARASESIVTLSSSSPQILGVPATVVIPAGATSAVFPLTANDNSSLNGPISVRVSATLPGLFETSTSIRVLDNETGTLAVSIPTPVNEQYETIYGTLTLLPVATSAFELKLTSSLPANAQVPGTVTVYPGQDTILFPINIRPDNKLTGNQTVVISANPPGWLAASASFVINDQEKASLSLTAIALLEGKGSTGIIYTGGSAGVNRIISLSSSDPSRLTVPATVTLPAGASSVTYAASAVENSFTEGIRQIIITASFAGLSGSATAAVYDNDVHHFSFAPIHLPQVRGLPFKVSVTARDINDVPISSYTGAVNFSAMGDAGALAVTPAASTAFTAGRWTGTIGISTFSTQVRLSAINEAGKGGSSNAFDVGTGPAHHYVWSDVPAVQAAGHPFSATLRAFDAGNNPATNSSEYVLLSALPVNRTIGAGTETSGDFPTAASAHDRRTQSIYLASEIGPAGMLSSLSLNITSLPGQALNNWTIRLKPTSLSSYSESRWESAGWTTVYNANQTFTQTGWATFHFSAPFAYDGISNLLVDFSFNNASASSSGLGAVFRKSPARTLVYSVNSFYGDPLNWSGSVPPPSTSSAIPQIKFNIGVPGPSVTPSIVFLNQGSWTGMTSLNAPAEGITLTAIDFTGGTGQSNSFSVQPMIDSDGDGLPDPWENAYGLASNDPAGAFGALGDFDLDGLPNLVEYAFNLDPTNGSVIGLPFSAIKTNPLDGLQYLEFTYRRLAGPSAVSYLLQTSEDCINWSANTAHYQPVGLVPAGDGITESVTARILPALNTPGRASRFVRVLISTP